MIRIRKNNKAHITMYYQIEELHTRRLTSVLYMAAIVSFA